jgi:hypothetical protein
MISRAPVKWLAAGSSAAFAALVMAQAPQTPGPEDLGPQLPPRYEVELIVFANKGFDPSEERFDQELNGLGEEPLAPLAAPPVFTDLTVGQPQATPPSVGVPPLANAPPPDPAAAAMLEALRVRPLTASELKLGSEYRKLAASAAYSPLLHTGWVQPGLPESEAPSFDLATLGVWNPRGTVRVHLGQVLLHITLDLTYEAAGPGATPLGVGDGLDEVSLAPRYRLTATRSSRSRELHYFDHPAFGALVRITPVPAPDANSSGRRPAA